MKKGASQQPGKLRQGGQIPSWGSVTPYPCPRAWPWPRNTGRRVAREPRVTQLPPRRTDGAPSRPSPASISLQPPSWLPCPSTSGVSLPEGGAGGARGGHFRERELGLVQVLHSHSEPSASVGCRAVLVGGGREDGGALSSTPLDTPQCWVRRQVVEWKAGCSLLGARHWGRWAEPRLRTQVPVSLSWPSTLPAGRGWGPWPGLPLHRWENQVQGQTAQVLPRIPARLQVLTPSEPSLGSRPSRRGTPPTVLLTRHLLAQPREAQPGPSTRGPTGSPEPAHLVGRG